MQILKSKTSKPKHPPALLTRSALILLPIGALVLAGCDSNRKGAPEASSLPAAEVRVQTIETKSRLINEEVVGTVRAKARATIEARLSGRIVEMPVRLGDTVRSGQLLARLDAREIGARLEQAEAALEQAERDLRRTSALFEQQSVTRAEYDSTEARHRMARAAAAEARVMLGYVEVKAPFDGVVARKWADVGDLASPGKPLVEVEDPSALQLEADVSETIAAHVRRGAPLSIRSDSLPGDLAGVVSEIAPAIDPLSRTFRVKVDLPQSPGLMSGQFARLAVPIGESQSVRVPIPAVIQRGQLEIAFSVADDRARLHLVKTGKRIGDEIEILAGLAAGQTVVVAGAERLLDGQPVEAR